MLSDTSLARLEEIHPELSRRIKQIDAMLPSLSIQVTQGLRSWTEQDSLYAEGRTQPGSIVTNTPGGFSWHNFGLACDVVPEDISPGQPDWDISHPAWDRLTSVGISLGLTSGSTWRTFKDYPHFQLTGRFPVNPDDEVRTLFRDGGIMAVWQESQILEQNFSEAT